MKLSYQELEEKLRQTQAILQSTEKRLLMTQDLLRKAMERITALEEKLNTDSKNSSKPPSTDFKADSKRKSRKERGPRKGICRTPYPQDRIDHHVLCDPICCPECESKNLTMLNEKPFFWQQVELPEVSAIVTQFECRKYRCQECGKKSMGSLPEGVPFSAFGSRLMALVGNLTGRFHLAKRESVDLIKEMYGIDIAYGSVSNIEEHVANALEGTYERIHRFVMKGKRVKYLDETTWRDNGKRHFVWIGSTEEAAIYQIDQRRSQGALKRLLRGNTHLAAVTDRYSAYNAIDGPRQYCVAHLIRDFHRFSQREGEDGEIAEKIEKELREICRIHTAGKRGEITAQKRGQRLYHRRRGLKDFLMDGLVFGTKDFSKLCEKLYDEEQRIWEFAKRKGMDPTNNMAERDLRKIVLWRKKSYGTRSERGQRFVERITSVIETLKKNGKNTLEYLTLSMERFWKNNPAPLISDSLGF